MSEGTSPEQARAALLPIRVGDVVAGKYRVDGVLGRGGMGAVFSAEQSALRRSVALKVLLPEIGAEASVRDRFLREAQLAASLRDEHVVQILDIGTLDTGEPFLVMERLEGLSLSDLSKERGPLPADEAIDYVLQACEAVLEAHGKGVIHRDLKPANMFATKRPSGTTLIKVLDFGLAKVIDGVFASHDASLTATGMLAGSPHYAPPEQLRSLKHADVRSDIWAVGVVLYELLSRRRPFDGGDGVAGIIARVLVDAPAPLAKYRPDLSPALVGLVHRCLEKDPSRRPQTVMELVQALRAVGRDGLGVSAAVAAPPSGPHTADVKTLLLTPAAHVAPTVTAVAPLPLRTPPAESLFGASPAVTAAPPEGMGTGRPTTHEVAAKAPGGNGRVLAAALGLGAVALVSVAVFVALRPGGSADASTAISVAAASASVAAESPSSPPSPLPPDVAPAQDSPAAPAASASTLASAAPAPPAPAPPPPASSPKVPGPAPRPTEPRRVAPAPAKTVDPTEKYE